jgi:membrane protease subunit HflK
MDWTPPGRGADNKKSGINQVIDDWKNKLPMTRGTKSLVSLVIILVLVSIGFSSYYTVQPEETGVVTRFGLYDRSTDPGLHFKIPFGIESVEIVKTGRVFTEEFGFRGNLTDNGSINSSRNNNRFSERALTSESLMLSGDLNVIDVKWIVQYQIRDPKLWLFAVRDGLSTIRDFSEAVMRRIVGNSYSDAVLTLQRVEIAIMAQEELQALLDGYNSGVRIVTVKLQDVTPPGPVQPAFNEVNEAIQQKERMINEAQEQYNREIPRAEGEALAMITEAEGYALEVVNRAQGQAERFNQVYLAYTKTKDVTQKRYYLDAITRTLNNAKQIYVVDESVKGLLPMLNLRGGE